MKSEESEFFTDGLLYHCNNPGQSSHESIDSGCCEAETLISGCQKQPFINFKRVPAASHSHKNPSQNLNSYPASNRITPTKQRGPTKKDENSTSNTNKESIQNESGGPSYKYLTWREKDRRRRFREEWKHLWLVVPHGMYEVMCLVCKKIMTQRKLDTIKRHTIRRHAELLSMSDSERQRLYNELFAHYFRRGGDLCSESEVFSTNSVPKLRAIGPRSEIRRNQRLPTDIPPSAFRSRAVAPSRCENEKSTFMNLHASSEQLADPCKPAMPPVPPVNMKMFENLLSNEQNHSAFTKYLMGFQPNQFLPRGKLDPSASPIGRRNPLSHTYGMGTSHAFQAFRKQMSAPLQRLLPESYSDSLNTRAPLDMTTSNATSPVQVTPDDLSLPRYPTANSEPGASLTERLMRLMNTWDSAAVNSKSLPSFPLPPPLPTSIPLLPSLLSPQIDGTTLMLNR
nr:asparagine rich protein [Hymenolepis microstoma]